MAKAFNQKMKILYLIQMLMKNTDAEHVLNMQEIIALLDEKGIKSERKSIYDDFETMRQFGISVRFKKSQPSGYYVESRDLDLPEIQTIVRALKSSKDISPEEMERLMEKLSHYLSIYQTERMIVEEVEEEQTQELEEHLQEVIEEPKEEVQILFKEKHTGAVLQQFGPDINIKQHKDSIYKVKVMTVVDAAFYGWLSSHGMGIKVVKPKNVAEDYRIYLKKLLKQYK